jgi:Flp pilus assembly pilin Flp
MKELLQRYWDDETGLTSVEYMILLAMVVMAAMVGFTPLMDATGVEESVKEYDAATGR